MKSLQKSLDVLEYVVLRNGEKVTPSRVAEALALNLATCTRIMGEFVKRGYLVQVSRKDGYLPGPMIASLVTRRNPWERLADAARGPIRDLSETLRRQVNLAVMNRNRRIMLTYHLGQYDLKPWDHFFFIDHWDTATGRLLIAALDDRDARKILAEAGIRPFPRKELEAMRKNGFVRFRLGELEIIGHAVRVPGCPAAAFGFGVEPEQADEAFAASSETAQRIVRTLEQPNQAY